MNLVKFVEQSCHTVSTTRVSVNLKINKNGARPGILRKLLAMTFV